LEPSEHAQLIKNSVLQTDFVQSTSLNSTGVWKVKLLSNNFDVLTIKFLILSLDNLNEIDSFWQFESICLNTNIINNDKKYKFLTDRHLNDCSNSYWSSFYSDLKSNLTNDYFKYRI
jgi:hypothetical protein